MRITKTWGTYVALDLYAPTLDLIYVKQMAMDRGVGGALAYSLGIMI